MGIFDALSGRIGHFNSAAVPVPNNIFTKIKVLSDETEIRIFATSLDIAQHGVDLFFKPGVGPVMKDVKQYDWSHFEKLYAIFLIWIFHDYCNLGLLDRQKEQGKLENILGIDKEEFTHYLEQLKHGSENPVGLDKLWNEIVKIVHTMPNTQENYLVFVREFSRICRIALQ